MTRRTYRVVIVELPRQYGGLMAYIADEEALGRREEDRERGIRIIVPEALERGDRVGEEGLESIMLRPEIWVLLIYGSRAVEKAVSLGLADPDSVLDIGGLRHVIVYKFGGF